MYWIRSSPAYESSLGFYHKNLYFCRYFEELKREKYMSKQKLHSQQIVACIWDFDKTLIPDYMQTPLFKRYKVDAQQFWQEVEALPEHYSKRGYRVNPDTLYLNHLLSYVKHGQMKGLNNAVLRQLGEELTFYPGLPDLFQELREIVTHK